MALREPRILKDGWLSSYGGMDSGRNPSLIDADQVAYSHNAVMRGGFLDNRMGFLDCDLTFADTEMETWFTTYKLQGRTTYLDGEGNRMIVASVGGRIFLIDPNTFFNVTEITPTTKFALTAGYTAGDLHIHVNSVNGLYEGYPLWINGDKWTATTVSATALTAVIAPVGHADTTNYASGLTVFASDPNNPDLDKAWMLQADEWLIVQDDQSSAILFDGTDSRRAIYTTNLPEIPVGSSMVYVNGRIWVAVNKRDIAAGDIFGGPTSVITFSEETFIAEGGRFHVDEDIVALFDAVNLDTSTGQGPVLVVTRDAVWSINVPAAGREQWKNLNYPIQTVILNQGGSVAHESLVQVNSDVFYRSGDGIRSLGLAGAEQRSWGSVPVSEELSRILNDDFQTFLDSASAILFNNRLIMTVSPFLTPNGIGHRGLVALDFAPVSRMGQKGHPTWDGLWTGLLTTHLLEGEFNGRNRAFAFAFDTSLYNKLVELCPNYHRDNDTTRVQSFIESRSFNFGNPMELKKLMACELWVDNVEGTVDFDLRWRPDQSPCWYVWGTKTICVQNQNCSSTCQTLKNYKPGYRSRMGFGIPDDSQCEPFDNKPASNGYEFQVRIQWTGKARLRKMLLKANIIEEPPLASCNE